LLLQTLIVEIKLLKMITCYYPVKEFVYPDLPPLDIPRQEKEHTGQIELFQ